MRPRRKLTRRSFVRRVLGSSIATGVFALIGGEARAQVTDSDPNDPVGQGRGGGTGVTDSDSGAGADRVGQGRGGGVRTGDSDASDPAGNARYPDRRRYMNINGTWEGSNGITYVFVQTDDHFTWELPSGEHGLGRVGNGSAWAQWWGPDSRGEATAELQEEQYGRVVEIRWSNGVVLRRPGN